MTRRREPKPVTAVNTEPDRPETEPAAALPETEPVIQTLEPEHQEPVIPPPAVIEPPAPVSVSAPVTVSPVEIPTPMPEARNSASVPVANTVPLDVYLAVCGKRWDTMAGFRRWVTKQRLDPMTIPQWQATYDQFLARPV